MNSGPPKTNPSIGREEEDLNPGPPDYESSALPLGHARLPTISVETLLISEEGMLNLMDLLRSFLDILLLLFFSLDSGQHRELYLLVLHDGRSIVCCFPDTSNNNFHQLPKV